MNKLSDYPFDVRPLSSEEGGGYLISFPDFAECISDGETVEEAIVNGRDALKATIAALKAMKHSVPAPNSGGVASGKFVARVPKTVHAQLATRARAEGVSLNALVLTFIAQGLGVSGANPSLSPAHLIPMKSTSYSVMSARMALHLCSCLTGGQAGMRGRSQTSTRWVRPGLGSSLRTLPSV